jgi:ubiquinone/menaquinone biosynthesis C-methylase UbiE
MSQHRHATTDDNRTATSPAVGERPKTAADIRSTYASMADRVHRYDWVDRFVTGSYRRRLFGDVEGPVLDVACGTGTNFHYLPEGVDLVGVDISPEMLSYARETLADLDRSGELHEMDAQDLAFPDDRFSTVISALSTCTFPDPLAALAEMKRVCRPEGRIELVEHGQSDLGPLAWFQRAREDAHYESTGCRWTQEPLELVRRAGLEVQDVETGFFGTITSMTVKPVSS